MNHLAYLNISFGIAKSTRCPENLHFPDSRMVFYWPEQKSAILRRLSVRRATREDSDQFLTLLVALANFEHLKPPSGAAKTRIIRDIFVRERANLFVASEGGRLVGYALYFYTYSSFLASSTLYLEDIFVLEEFRGRGIGKSLFIRCVKEAVVQSCGRMEWSVLTWNRDAITFYEKLGAERMDDWYIYRLTAARLRALAEESD
jgi:GNAT superfamily N-acetyltransferase